MENVLPESLAALIRLLHVRDLAVGLARAGVLLGGIFVAIYLLEWWLGKDRARYRSRHFANDLAYFLFYQSGLYHLMLGALVVSALRPQLAFLQIDALAALPAPAHWVMYWVIIDFCDYWLHRLKHHSGVLWAFHAIHHSQERMTFITSWRFHPFEQLFANVVMLVPLLILGVPPSSWLPIVLVMNAFESVQHAQLNWTYGPLYKVFVSPVFHAIHHSTDREHHDTNYAKIFSAWDFMFGTGVEAPRPVETGIVAPRIPETLSAQFVAPFRSLTMRAEPESVPTPAARRQEEPSA